MSTVVARARYAAKFRQFVHETTGIQLAESKDRMVEGRLRPRLAALGIGDVEDYFRFLFEEDGAQRELPFLTELITTNKTDFFREKAHFAVLWDRMIPEALRLPKRGGRATFKLWSAAASNGAEAWSAAMILAEARVRSPELDWAVLGTDISQRVLAAARRAIYPEADLAPVPAALRDRYTMTGRDAQGAPLRRIVPELRQRVRFEELNLMDRTYALDRELDVAFLRNVLIYFDPPTQARVVAAVAAHLRPGGHLVVGHAESMIVRQPDLRQVAPAVFQRVGPAEVPK